MNNISPIYQEFLVRLQQRNLEAEIRLHRLQNEASPVHARTSGWVAHRIAHFAEWMIVTGESPRRREQKEHDEQPKPRGGTEARQWLRRSARRRISSAAR